MPDTAHSFRSPEMWWLKFKTYSEVERSCAPEETNEKRFAIMDAYSFERLVIYVLNINFNISTDVGTLEALALLFASFGTHIFSI